MLKTTKAIESGLVIVPSCLTMASLVKYHSHLDRDNLEKYQDVFV